MNTSRTSLVEEQLVELTRELNAIARDVESSVEQRAERCGRLYERIRQLDSVLGVSARLARSRATSETSATSDTVVKPPATIVIEGSSPPSPTAPRRPPGPV